MASSNIIVGLQKENETSGTNNISIGHMTGLDCAIRSDSIAIGNGCLKGEDGVWIGAASTGGPVLTANSTSVCLGHVGSRVTLGRMALVTTDDAVEFHVGGKVARLRFEADEDA